MTRLAWGGGESGSVRGDGNDIAVMTPAPAIDGTVAHGGAYSYKATATSQAMRAAWTAVDGRWFYARAWYRVDALPTADVEIMRWWSNVNSATTTCLVLLKPSGQISYAGGAGSGVVLSPAVSANAWFCVEYGIRGRVGSPGGYDVIYRLNGVTLGTHSSSSVLAASGLPDAVRWGQFSTPSSPMTALWFDDLAVNDETGSAQNAFPGIDGKIIHLLPVSDSAVGTDWKSNTLTAFSPGAYDCVDNRPPLNNPFGTTAQVQARDNVSNIAAPAADLDVLTAAYSSVLGAGDAVQVCQHRLWIADSNASLQHQVAGRTVSNPAEAAETAYSTLAVAGSSGTLTNSWAPGFGPVTYNPAVNKANGAVLRIGKRTATTDSVGCCYAALQVEYGPATNAQRFLAVA